MKRNTCAVVRRSHCYYCLSVACSHSLSPGSLCHYDWLFVENTVLRKFSGKLCFFSNILPGWPWRCLPVAPPLIPPSLSPEDWDVKVAINHGHCCHGHQHPGQGDDEAHVHLERLSDLEQRRQLRLLHAHLQQVLSIFSFNYLRFISSMFCAFCSIPNRLLFRWDMFIP